MTASRPFPLSGVLGVVGGDRVTVDRSLSELESLLAEPSLVPGSLGVELRADLFDRPRDALETLRRLAGRAPVLFTVRLEAEGGRYRGDESTRLRLYDDALAAGAAAVDAEWRSEAGRRLARGGAPLVLSWHSFEGMPTATELARWTREMEALQPLAIKVVPTATTPSDGCRMLEWVAAAGAGAPRRIGFAMGEVGLPSRVLSLARGAPCTYASLANAVAPGQVSARDLLILYRAPQRSRRTRVLGVVGRPVGHSLSPHLHNPALGARSIDAVYLPFLLERFEDLEPILEPLGIDGVSVTIPFKEAAHDFAIDDLDERARACGAANTLVFERGGGAPRRVRGYNTDFDGVLGPLRRRGVGLEGLEAAIIGNGGAARGAARALASAGSRVTIYYRNEERGRPVAERLGVASAHRDELVAASGRLIINATPLGLRGDDPSPVPAAVFAPGTVAFDMVYGSGTTRFLEDARARGAVGIPGAEMLIAQGLAQFRLFTGEEATLAEFEESLRRATGAAPTA